MKRTNTELEIKSIHGISKRQDFFKSKIVDGSSLWRLKNESKYFNTSFGIATVSRILSTHQRMIADYRNSTKDVAYAYKKAILGMEFVGPLLIDFYFMTLFDELGFSFPKSYVLEAQLRDLLFNGNTEYGKFYEFAVLKHIIGSKSNKANNKSYYSLSVSRHDIKKRDIILTEPMPMIEDNLTNYSRENEFVEFPKIRYVESDVLIDIRYALDNIARIDDKDFHPHKLISDFGKLFSSWMMVSDDSVTLNTDIDYNALVEEPIECLTCEDNLQNTIKEIYGVHL